jgi:hypothetical protein
MSAVAELFDRIQETVALIEQYEKAAARPNAPRSLFAQIRGLEKFQRSLEKEFEQHAVADQLEMVRYSLLPADGQRPVIDAVSSAWRQYQHMFSSVYASIAKGEVGKRISKQTLQETQFNFGYCYSGSIGLALTLPTKQITNFAARDLERTIQTIFEMAQARTTESLGSLADRVGRLPMVSFKKWVDAHVKFAAGAGLEWTGPVIDPIPPLVVQIQEFKALQTALSTVSDAVEEERTVTGLLTGAWMRSRHFEMELDSGEVLTGEFVDAITAEHAARLPRRYVARVRTTRVIKPATEEEDVSHFLIDLVRELPI